MHHYKHHIGDFRSNTAHLTNDEELAYRRMLEVYYDSEQPLPANIEWIARRVRCAADVVQRVLADFFTLDGDVWRQARCDRELTEYRKAVRQARANGKRGGRPAKGPDTEPEPTRFPSGSSPGAGSKTPQPPTPNPRSPTPNSVLSTPSHSEGGTQSGEGRASPEAGDGERGAEPAEPDPGERQAIFALLSATPLRSNSKNRRQILDEIAGAVVADGMGSDQARRLIAKAKAETKGDYGALLGEWFRPGAWRDKWAEIVSGRVGGLVAGVAARTRARA